MFISFSRDKSQEHCIAYGAVFSFTIDLGLMLIVILVVAIGIKWGIKEGKFRKIEGAWDWILFEKTHNGELCKTRPSLSSIKSFPL